jgi:hypothetical protein
MTDSRRNVFHMREFTWPIVTSQKCNRWLHTSATHNLIVLQRCKDPLEQEFYIRMTRKVGWTKNVQRLVVAVLSTYDDLIENNRRRMALFTGVIRGVRVLTRE